MTKPNDDSTEGTTYIFPLSKGKELLSSPELLFLGRGKLQENLSDSLKATKHTRLSVLIGGYRGVGKTQLVENCIKECETSERDTKILTCKINLGIDQKISTFTVLSDLAENIQDNYEKYWNHIRKRIQISFLIILLFLNFLISSIPLIRYLSFERYAADVLPNLVGLKLLVSLLIIAIALPRILAVARWNRTRSSSPDSTKAAGESKFLDKKLHAARIKEFYRSALSYCVVGLLLVIGYLSIQEAYSLLEKSPTFDLIREYSLISLGLLPGTAIFAFITSVNLFYTSGSYTFAHSIHKRLSALVENIRYSKLTQQDYTIGSGNINARLSKVVQMEPVKERRIEMELVSIFQDTKNKRFPTEKALAAICVGKNRVKYLRFFIIFDELDKVGLLNDDYSSTNPDTKSRQIVIDQLLSGLKSFVTSSKATFIFIAGREAVDSYHSESGNKSALYEGLFDQIYYIPTLLTDRSDGRSFEIHSLIQSYVYSLISPSEMDYCETKSIRNLSYERIGDALNLLDEHSMNGTNYNSFGNTIRINRKRKWFSKQENIYIHDQLSDEIHENEKAYTEETLFILRIFIRYLVFHSWGNCRRLTSLIRQFTETPLSISKENPETNWRIFGGQLNDDQHYLKFDSKQLLRLIVSSQLYALLESSHTRLLSQSDDKLVVSTLITLQDISKFHGLAFSRQHLDRTIEGIDIHAEPHLHLMVDDVLNSAMYSTVRRIYNNIFNYRFFSIVEENYRYLSRRIGARAASFEFGLDSAEPVRKYYSKYFATDHLHSAPIDNNSHGIAHNEVILGDLYFWERSYDESIVHYTNAIQFLKSMLIDEDNKWIHSGAPSFSAHTMLVRVLLKVGLLEEVRNHYEIAWRFYREAQHVSSISLAKSIDISPDRLNDEALILFRENYSSGDVKHLEIYVNSVSALDFLYLKRGKQPRPNLYRNFGSRRWEPKYDQGIFLKLSIVHFIGLDFNSIRQSLNSMIIELPVSEWGHTNCLLALLFAQSELIDCLQICRDEREKLLQAALALAEEDSELLDFKEKRVRAVFGNSLSDIQQRVCASFFLLSAIARRLSNLGFHARASYIYLNMLSVWIAVLEAIPWRSLDISMSKPELQNIKNLSFPGDLLQRIVERNESAERAAFANMRNHADIDVPSAFEFLEKSIRHSSASEIDSNTFGTNIFWYRSPLERLAIVVALWDKYARNRISGTFAGIGNESQFHVDPISTGGDKSAPIVNWLRGRALQDQLESFSESMKNGKNLSTNEKSLLIEKATDTIYQIVKHFYYAMFENKMLSPSGNPLSLPPRCHIYYNNWESLHTYYQMMILFHPDSISSENCEENISNNLHKHQLNLKKKFSDPTDFVPYSMIDYAHIRGEAIRALAEFNDINEVSSPSYQQLIQNKYYLSDDFEDPLFKIEWTFIQILSVGANSHIEVIKETNFHNSVNEL